jgi:1-deoxy-D-xylulose-5-phosphate synthase
MEINHDIFTITPAMIVGSKLENIQNKYPDRMIDVGIAEAHAVTLASSLSLAGKKSFISIYSTFLQRAYDSILHDCAISNTNVVFGIDRAGFSTGDGERNHGIYDISFLMGIPNTIITMPKDSIEAQNLLHTGFSLEKNPFFVRYPREDVEYTFNKKPRKLKIGS